MCLLKIENAIQNLRIYSDKKLRQQTQFVCLTEEKSPSNGINKCIKLIFYLVKNCARQMEADWWLYSTVPFNCGPPKVVPSKQSIRCTHYVSSTEHLIWFPSTDLPFLFRMILFGFIDTISILKWEQSKKAHTEPFEKQISFGVVGKPNIKTSWMANGMENCRRTHLL